MSDERARWYSVRCIFEMRMGPSWRPREDRLHEYEERITLWRGNSFDEAIARAELEAIEFAADIEVEYLGVAQAYALDDDLDAVGDGTEIFSLMRPSAHPAEEYVSKYIETPEYRHTERYEHHTRSDRETAFALRQLELANDVVALVLADLQRASPARPEVVVDVVDDHTIRISVNGGFTTPSMWAVERSHALVEVASYVQEQLDQELGCWPVCRDHDVGLHAEVHDGAAMWWCRVGDHAVGLIGELGLST